MYSRKDGINNLMKNQTQPVNNQKVQSSSFVSKYQRQNPIGFQVSGQQQTNGFNHQDNNQINHNENSSQNMFFVLGQKKVVLNSPPPQR